MERQAREDMMKLLGVDSPSKVPAMEDEIEHLKLELEAEKRKRQQDIAKAAADKAQLEDQLLTVAVTKKLDVDLRRKVLSDATQEMKMEILKPEWDKAIEGMRAIMAKETGCSVEVLPRPGRGYFAAERARRERLMRRI
jgi:hypothetical protein